MVVTSRHTSLFHSKMINFKQYLCIILCHFATSLKLSRAIESCAGNVQPAAAQNSFCLPMGPFAATRLLFMSLFTKNSITANDQAFLHLHRNWARLSCS